MREKSAIEVIISQENGSKKSKRSAAFRIVGTKREIDGIVEKVRASIHNILTQFYESQGEDAWNT